MKVKDVIKSMQEYDLEDEVVILWWTKDIFDDSDEDTLIAKDIWSKAVVSIDNGNHLDFESESAYESILNEIRAQEVSA